MAKNFWDKDGFNLADDLVHPFEDATKEYDHLLDRYAVLDNLVQALSDRTYRDVLLRRCAPGREEETVGYIVREYMRARTAILSASDVGKQVIRNFDRAPGVAKFYVNNTTGEVSTQPGEGFAPFDMTKKHHGNHNFDTLLEDLQLELAENGN